MKNSDPMPKPLLVPVTRSGLLHLPATVLKDRYQILNADLTPLEDLGGALMVKPIGAGGFGAVIRARDELGIDRAVKLVPNAEIVGNHGSPSGTTTAASTGAYTQILTREIELTNCRPFRNILNIIDYGNGRDLLGIPYGFLVSPYIQGCTVETYITSLEPHYEAILENEHLRALVHDQILIMISDLLSALNELEHARVVHMDIKPTNMLVCPIDERMPVSFSPSEYAKIRETPLRACVIDLGAGKPVERQLVGNTHLRLTKVWFPQHLLPALGHDRARGTIAYSDLDRHWQHIDRYSFGLVLRWIFLDICNSHPELARAYKRTRAMDARKAAFWGEVYGDDYADIETLLNQMTALDGDTVSPRAAKSYIETIPLRCARGVLASDILTDRHPRLRIRPGGAIVKVAKPIDAIVEHSAFQRLRLVQQLSLVDRIFPEATHTRFAHSLRTFSLAKQFIFGLNRKSAFRLAFDRAAIDRLLAGALLHDLGQYHFSHTIEDLRKIGTYDGDSRLSSIPHDHEHVSTVLQQAEAGETTIAALLEQMGIDVEDLLYIVRKDAKMASKGVVLNISRDIISGLADVDRVAYLVHDSDRTGVPYGGAVDVESFIEALTVRTEAPPNAAMSGLGIEEAGVGAAESVLAGVYWMYKNVYWRHTNRAFMAAVKYVMRRLLTDGQMPFDRYLAQTHWCDDWEALKWLHSAYEDWTSTQGDGWASPLAELVRLRRVGYRRVVSLRGGKHDNPNGGLYRRMLASITTRREDELLDAIATDVFHGTNPRKGDILIDVPLKGRLHAQGVVLAANQTQGERGVASVLWVCCRSPLTREIVEWKDLRDYSLLAAQLKDIEDNSARKVRVFCSRRLLERAGLARQQGLEKAILRVLDERTQEWSEDRRTS